MSIKHGAEWIELKFRKLKFKMINTKTSPPAPLLENEERGDGVGSMLLIFLLLLFISKISFGTIINTDTTKQQYALNDPRNPNCPCHKYQKLAEEEYRDLLKEKHTIYKSKNKHHSKSLIELFFIRKKGIKNNHIKTKKHKNRNNLCYKF